MIQIKTKLKSFKSLKLKTSGMIKLYCRFIDDTLLLVVPANVQHVPIYSIDLIKNYVS